MEGPALVGRESGEHVVGHGGEDRVAPADGLLPARREGELVAAPVLAVASAFDVTATFEHIDQPDHVAAVDVDPVADLLFGEGTVLRQGDKDVVRAHRLVLVGQLGFEPCVCRAVELAEPKVG